MADFHRLPPRRSIGWQDGKVLYIDQRLLPNEEHIVCTDDWRVMVEAIKTLAVRGAPLIGISAAYAVALSAFHTPQGIEQREYVAKAMDEIANARPTAINLLWAVRKMREVFEDAPDAPMLADRLLEEALAIHNDDAYRCEQIGLNGLEILPDPCNILTVCNTGFLATGGDGTAAAIFYQAQDAGKNIHVFAPETRPLLQGARLTVWEMTRAGIPVTLFVDSAAAGLVRDGKVNVCIIGADRIAANGDTANKIGSLQLALICKHYNVPYYVAAPDSTIDRNCPDGEHIPIELRNGSEVLVNGKMSQATYQGSIETKKLDIFNPAFDIVPSELISGVITDKGIFQFPYQFDKLEGC